MLSVVIDNMFVPVTVKGTPMGALSNNMKKKK